MDVSRFDTQSSGRWLGSSPKLIREAFNSFARISPFFELFDGVALGHKPRRDRKFEIVRSRITVDVEKRDGARLACNLCGPADKFIKSGILIVDELGWLYFVGPVCAKQFFDGEFAHKLAKFERTEDEDAARDFLISNLAKFGVLFEQCENMIAPATAAQALHSKLRKLPLFRELHRAINRQDGWLRIDREYLVPLQSGRVRKESRSENFALVKGAAVASPSFELTQKLAFAKSVLSQFSGSESDSLEALCAIERNGRLLELSEKIRKVEAILQDVELALNEYSEFFSAENFREIRRWSLDDNCPIHFSITIQEGSRTISMLNSSISHRFEIIGITSVARNL